MSEANIGGSEPNPFSPPVREFLDGRQIPFENLNELRRAMIEDDRRLVAVVAAKRMAERIAILEAGTVEDRNNDPTAVDILVNKYPNEAELPGLVCKVFNVLYSETSPIFQFYDEELIDVIAARLQKAKYATVFKWNQAEGLAPQQQSRNRERVVAIATQEYPEDPDLTEVIGRLYAVLVPETVAIQQKEFVNTRLLPEVWDFGPMHLYDTSDQAA